MDSHALLCRLQQTGRVRSPEATAIPLSGGVSSEIWLVTDGPAHPGITPSHSLSSAPSGGEGGEEGVLVFKESPPLPGPLLPRREEREFIVRDSGPVAGFALDAPERFVVKRALPKLKVRDDWFADPARNSVEHDCLAYLDRVAPGSVPRILFRDAEAGLFAMEFLDEGFANWKAELLRGVARKEDAARAARLMATVHGASFENSEVRAQFQTWPNFHALRVEPYLLTTGSRHPKLNPLFEEEAQRLGRTAQSLVHGDFSPKNILISRERLVLLDCEAAWFGDPAFDAAFLLNHLFLKSLHLPAWRDDYLRLASVCWSEYSAGLAERFEGHLASRIGRLLLMLMLARIDGKSPVEYIVEESKKEFVRDFVGRMLPAGAFAMEEIIDNWRRSLTTQ